MISDHNDADFEEKVKQVSVKSEDELWLEGRISVYRDCLGEVGGTWLPAP